MEGLKTKYRTEGNSPLRTTRESRNNNNIELSFASEGKARLSGNKIKVKRREQNQSYREESKQTNDYIKFPVIRISQSDDGYQVKRRDQINRVRRSYNGQTRETSPYSYIDDTKSSIVPKSTGILDTINEERNKSKKRSILDIFEKNYDMSSHHHKDHKFCCKNKIGAYK